MSSIKRICGDEVEQDFMNAIKRLQEGKPKNMHLKEKMSLGKLKLNTSSVALEAGRSRTLIGLEECRYPKIRELIKELSGNRSRDLSFPTTLTELVEKLRFEKAVLTSEVKKYQAEAAIHFLARVKAEKALGRQRTTSARMARELAEQNNVISIIPKSDHAD